MNKVALQARALSHEERIRNTVELVRELWPWLPSEQCVAIAKILVEAFEAK